VARTFFASSSDDAPAAETCCARCLSQSGEEKRWARMNEHRSRNLLGTIVGSCVLMSVRILRWRCLYGRVKELL
jgi:hypothetical protein